MKKAKDLLKKIDKYSDNVRKRSLANLPGGVEQIVKILKKAKPKVVLEIGTYKGVSAAIISKYCERVYTIDLAHGRLEQVKDRHDRYDFWSTLGIKNIDLFLAVTDMQKKRYVESLEFDFAFIDGEHTTEGVEFDFDLVRKCGRVLFHDYDDSGVESKNYVYNFVNSINEGKLEKYPEACFAYWKA